MEKMELKPEILVRQGASFAAKEEAVREACGMLVRAGCVESDYAESMLKRESVNSTYLGKGLAIPHGMAADKIRVHKDGFAVLQIPAGVDWGDGERASIVIAIAAGGDTHLELMRTLVKVLHNDQAMEKIKNTPDAEVIVKIIETYG
ncbi:MAG: PTS sugar transporter subunit IIA [Treponema sp.]|jgi:phosphocarrier protein FPr|nr:PTS sugar transporter subunit IIA [Treponema sp.]